MKPCACTGPHLRRRVVLTGGPGAGKTAVLELIRHSFCRDVLVLPEAAGIVFGGGFPRRPSPGSRQAAQRAIFHVQRELEAEAECGEPAMVLCDRGTIDGAAYWPDPPDFWSSVGATLESELLRYHAVIHLQTPGAADGYNRQNPLRTESAAQAVALDSAIAALWANHPLYFSVDAQQDFLSKAARAINFICGLLPECCSRHAVPEIGNPAPNP